MLRRRQGSKPVENEEFCSTILKIGAIDVVSSRRSSVCCCCCGVSGVESYVCRGFHGSSVVDRDENCGILS